ncbi:MAG: ATP-binding protein, partial [Rhodothermales bacterium]
MGWLQRLTNLVVPRRATTQTWMILTFALFVGPAVLAVGVYVTFALRGETSEATRQMLVGQAERIAIQLERVEAPEDQLEVARDISRLTDVRITLVRDDSVLWDVDRNGLLADDDVLMGPEINVGPEDPVRYASREDEADNVMLFAAVYRSGSNLVVRIGQREPPLVSLVQNMLIALVVGMAMALLLALLGSWVAAHQVTSPLLAIRNSARRIAEGDLGEKIKVDSRAAEFHELAMSLNRMSDSLKRQINELQRLTQLQNDFIGNVSHEVRNPIFAVSGYLEALGSGTLTPEMRKRYAEKGLINLHRLQNLFNDLIEIARLEYREDLIKPSVFDLEELTDEVGDILRPKAAHKGLNLELENPRLFVHADRNRIRQVLTNLIDNAIAYTDEGTVRCRFRRRLEKVRVEIIDTGRGIPEDHLERIFERFYRVDPDRSRRSGGTGLGLSIVHQILHAHGERIHVESTVGRGIRFWF